MATITDPTPMPRVLVAEDDAAIRRLLATTLRRRRLEVELAEDGAQARQALERERWDVLVMDLMMPHVNGWDLVRWLAAHPECKPGSVIVVSAADRDALRELDPGVVNAIIFKPFDVVQLGTYVKNAAQRNGQDRRRVRSLRSI
jgi:two-component system chemotaxis response regulator CheY